MMPGFAAAALVTLAMASGPVSAQTPPDVVLGSLIVTSTLVTGSDSDRSLTLEQQKPDVQSPAPEDAAAIQQRVKENQKVRVIDDQGREWHGRIAALTPDTLTMITKDRQRRDVPYATILRIDRPHDGVANGAAIGFVSGAVIGLAALISEEVSDCEPSYFFSCGPDGRAYVAVPVLFGALGAGVGVGIDALVRRDGNLWRRGGARVALAPAFGRGVRGLRVSVQW